MPQSQTNDLDPQSKLLLQEYEFQINSTYETRPTIEYRRRGTFQWNELALITPGSNYFLIITKALLAGAKTQVHVVEEEKDV